MASFSHCSWSKVMLLRVWKCTNATGHFLIPDFSAGLPRSPQVFCFLPTSQKREFEVLGLFLQAWGCGAVWSRLLQQAPALCPGLATKGGQVSAPGLTVP